MLHEMKMLDKVRANIVLATKGLESLLDSRPVDKDWWTADEMEFLLRIKQKLHSARMEAEDLHHLLYES